MGINCFAKIMSRQRVVLRCIHTFYRMSALTVVQGRIGYQLQGQQPQYAGVGETVLFNRGVPHRFWNDGEDILHCTGWIKPANTIVFYLTSIYAAQNKSGTARPELFDGAYLLKRYAAEYDMAELPRLSKKSLFLQLTTSDKLWVSISTLGMHRNRLKTNYSTHHIALLQ